MNGGKVRPSRLLVLAALVGVLLPPLPHAAGSTVQALVVTGHGNTHSDVTLRFAITLPKRPTTFTTRGCGRFGGFYAHRLDGPPGVPATDYGLLDHARFDYTNLYYRQPVALGQAALGDRPGGDGNVSLPAGRYRIHLFGEGAACEVRVPVLRGLTRALTVRPIAPTRVQYDDADLVLPVPASDGPHLGTATFSMDVSSTTYAVAAVHHWQREPREGPNPPQAADACLDAVPAATCSPSRTVTDRVQSYERRRHPDGSTYRAVTVYEYASPGTLAPGSSAAKTYAIGPPGDWTAAGAMMAFDLF